MPLTGSLRSWNDERGFGFIAPAGGGPEVFVHVSAFPRDGSRPTIGEKLAFEIGRGRDGRPQAIKVVRIVAGKSARVRRSAVARRGERSSWARALVPVLVVGAIATYGYYEFTQRQKRHALAEQPAVPTADNAARPAHATFKCDGRTHCSQMTSCAEATWFINNCPGTRMDGDEDGVPCERQWCMSP